VWGSRALGHRDGPNRTHVTLNLLVIHGKKLAGHGKLPVVTKQRGTKRDGMGGKERDAGGMMGRRDGWLCNEGEEGLGWRYTAVAS
jgi:hypothetical protein